MIDPKRKEKLERILKIISIFTIICCCALLFPQTRTFFIEIVEKALGRNLRDHNKWMSFLLTCSVFAIICFGIILIFLSKLVIINRINKIIYRHKEVITCIMLFLVVLILELIFFRGMIFNSNNLIGAIGDSRYFLLVMEHWYKVFCGQEAIRDFSMFYPVKNTLGYADTIFLLSLPYSFLRAIGYQWMTAYQLTLIGTQFFGGLCLAWFLRKSLRLSFFACVIGLIIGNFSNSYFVKIGQSYTNFVTFSLVPLFFIFLKNFYDCLTSDLKRSRNIYGIISIFLFAGIMLTGFYMGFFLAIFLLILHIVMVIYLLKNNCFKVEQVLQILRNNKFEILMYFVCGIIALLPFFWIYLPVFNELGGRSWGEVATSLPYWYDLFNVSPSNLIWSFPNTPYRHQYGFPLITGILLIVICIIYIKRYFNSRSQDKNITFYITIGFSLTIAVIILFILNLEILNNSFSLWYFIYKLIPGASAIREVSRFNQFLSLPTGILIAIFLSERIRFSDKINRKAFLTYMILIALIFLEHQNTANYYGWSKSSMNDYLDKVSPPPVDCESFFLVNDNNSIPSFQSVYHLDAWTIATRFNIKTINGSSSLSPGSYGALINVELNKNYTDLSYWINRYNLNNVYLYDYINDNWFKCTENALEEFQSNARIEYFNNIRLEYYNLGESIDLGKARSRYQHIGWSWYEGWGTWTEGDEADLSMIINSTKDLYLYLNIPMIANTDPVDIYINDVLLGSYEFVIGHNVVRIPDDLYPDNKLVIRFVFKNPISPLDLGQGNDSRKLGIGISSFYITE
jgi:hypothetical protein